MKFVRRLTVSNSTKSFCSNSQACPDIWKIYDNGEYYAVIGEDITNQAQPVLPKGVMLGTNEKIVRIPLQVLKSAKQNI